MNVRPTPSEAAKLLPASSAPNVEKDQNISLDDVQTFRLNAIANGYALIRVRSRSKAPLAREWQLGDQPKLLSDVRPDALNTGLLLAGLRCVDCDIDDPQLALEIMRAAHLHLPPGALIRRRRSSPRLAMLYRAAEGQPSKRVAKGSKGKVEILGLGQQAVVHGQHPSGAKITWQNGRGPETVPRDKLPAVSEEQITAFLNACEPLLGAIIPGVGVEHHRLGYPQGNHPIQGIDLAPLLPPEMPEAVFRLPRAAALFPLENDLAAGIESPNWFSVLAPQEKSAVLQGCLGVLDNATSDPRELWLRVLFSVADAERLGCQDARQLALEWSRRGASWTSEHDFDAAWNSFKPGGISVGSLLAMARSAGLDLSQWRDRALARCQIAAPPQAAAPPPSTPHPVSGRALCTTALPPVPRKRQWLHGTDLIRGAVSLLVAPGGRGKSSWLMTLSLACASNRPLLGTHVFGGPLRVLLISAEDPTSEVALRLRAAMKRHCLTDSDVPELHVIGADRWGISLLSPGAAGPILNRPGWDELTAELDRLESDVLIIDPLISVMGGASQNDNAAAALFMGQLVGVAAKRRIAVMVAHHAAKGRDPVSADSAMGAASFVNLSRIALAIEPLAAADAGSVGLPPWEARSVFRLVGTKHNLSPPTEGDRWFRLESVEMPNAEPPIYPNGDKVGVVEVFQPGVCGPRFSPEMIRDALRAIDSAPTPPSPSKRATGRYAGPLIAQAIAPHRGGRVSDIEAEAVLDHIIRSGLVVVQQVKLTRSGGRSDVRSGLVLTSAGKQEAHGVQSAPSNSSFPAVPAVPATFARGNAGGAPLGPPQRPRGCGGNAGAPVAGAPEIERNSSASKMRRAHAPDVTPSVAAEGVLQPAQLAPVVSPAEPPAVLAPASELGAPALAVLDPAAPAAVSGPSDNAGDLDIPPFLDRRRWAQRKSAVDDTLLRDPKDP